MEFEIVTVKYDDLSTAFDFISVAGPMEHRVYVSLDTGAISLDWRSRGLLSERERVAIRDAAERARGEL
jgi:hypothetical protein